jgi:hypothetical protein
MDLLASSTVILTVSILLFCLAFIVIFVVLPFGVVHLVQQVGFGERQDKNPKLKYYSAKDFGLTAKPISYPYKKYTIRGFVYYKGELSACKKLVIFAHGMGGGQASYTTEIAYYVNCGYAVLAPDYVGCDLTEGNGSLGFAAGAECIIGACLFAKSHEVLCNMPIVLVGHSWGGYNVLCAASKVKVQGVVAFSAFNSPTKAIVDAAVGMAGKKMLIVRLVRPYLWLYNFFKFGRMGNLKAGKAISKTNTPALLIHGAQDNVVPLSNSAAKKAKGKQVIIEPDKKHNPYNTVDAEVALGRLRSAITDDLSAEWFSGFDYEVATEEDQKVMSATKTFIETL